MPASALPSQDSPDDVESMFLDSHSAAKILGLSEKTIRDWRMKRQGPPFRVFSGRTIRYHRGELIEWANRHTPAPERAPAAA